MCYNNIFLSIIFIPKRRIGSGQKYYIYHLSSTGTLQKLLHLLFTNIHIHVRIMSQVGHRQTELAGALITCNGGALVSAATCKCL